jgi:hypothetical protein
MIMQHQFTEKICRASCLSPLLDERTAAMARDVLVREGFLDPVVKDES